MREDRLDAWARVGTSVTRNRRTATGLADARRARRGLSRHQTRWQVAQGLLNMQNNCFGNSAIGGLTLLPPMQCLLPIQGFIDSVNDGDRQPPPRTYLPPLLDIPPLGLRGKPGVFHGDQKNTSPRMCISESRGQLH